MIVIYVDLAKLKEGSKYNTLLILIFIMLVQFLFTFLVSLTRHYELKSNLLDLG